MSNHDHDDHDHDDHDHDDHDHAPPQPDEEDTPLTHFQLMEIALRELLVEKEVVSEAELRGIHEQMDRRGPHNGARMIARAWTDPGFRELIRTDATEAARQLGLEPTWLHLIVLENTPTLHNLVVCTLCSCYPWPLLGLPPDWYKSRAYRSDAVDKPASCSPGSAPPLPTTSKFGSTTARRTCATWSCRCVQPTPTGGPKINWPISSRGTR